MHIFLPGFLLSNVMIQLKTRQKHPQRKMYKKDYPEVHAKIQYIVMMDALLQSDSQATPGKVFKPQKQEPP